MLQLGRYSSLTWPQAGESRAEIRSIARGEMSEQMP
jgi:hypothetical protein